MDKYVDSSIQILKQMLGDQSNELGSERQRAFSREIRKLKKLKRQPNLKREDVYRVVSEVAKTISELM